MMVDEHEARYMCREIQWYFHSVEDLLRKLARAGYKDAGFVYENLYHAEFWVENMMTLFD